jgi:hypothetical protein
MVEIAHCLKRRNIRDSDLFLSLRNRQPPLIVNCGDDVLVSIVLEIFTKCLIIIFIDRMSQVQDRSTEEFNLFGVSGINIYIGGCFIRAHGTYRHITGLVYTRMFLFASACEIFSVFIAPPQIIP